METTFREFTQKPPPPKVTHEPITRIISKQLGIKLRHTAQNPKLRRYLERTKMAFRRNRSTTKQILTIRRILEGVHAKNLEAKMLFVDFFKAFNSIHRGKMEQILLTYGLHKETVAAIMMLYKNTKVRSPDRDTDYCDIVAGELQGDALAPYLFIMSRLRAYNVY